MAIRISVDLHSGVPVYRQLVEQVRFHVASGLLAPGEELPPFIDLIRVRDLRQAQEAFFN